MHHTAVCVDLSCASDSRTLRTRSMGSASLQVGASAGAGAGCDDGAGERPSRQVGVSVGCLRMGEAVAKRETVLGREVVFR